MYRVIKSLATADVSLFVRGIFLNFELSLPILQSFYFRGCKNGRCVRPNTCECSPGWSVDATLTNCVPGCSRPCLNGVCSAAETCTCHKGYVVDSVDKFK